MIAYTLSLEFNGMLSQYAEAVASIHKLARNNIEQDNAWSVCFTADCSFLNQTDLTLC